MLLGLLQDVTDSNRRDARATIVLTMPPAHPASPVQRALAQQLHLLYLATMQAAGCGALQEADDVILRAA